MSYEHVARLACGIPWAILPEKAQEIAALLELKLAGGSVSAETLDLYAAQAAPQYASGGAVAVLNLFGVISQRMNMMQQSSGGTSTEAFAQSFRQAMADPNVAAVILNIDSPGGNVFGVFELASEIRASRADKPTVSVANSLMASAAYGIGSAASEIVVTPGGQVGSIGVLAIHWDESAANEQAGLKPTVVTAGKYKAELSPTMALSEDAHGYLQEQVDAYYDLFVSAVAAGRGVAPSAVRSGFGRGRVVMASQAVAAGMADRVATLDQTIARLSTPQGRAAVMRRGPTAYLLPEPLNAEHQDWESSVAVSGLLSSLADAGPRRIVGNYQDGLGADVSEEDTTTEPLALVDARGIVAPDDTELRTRRLRL